MNWDSVIGFLLMAATVLIVWIVMKWIFYS